MNYLLAAGALSIVFIPIFLEHLERGDDKRSWEAFSVIANFILLAGSVGIALLIVFARPLASVIAPGFTSPAEVDTLVRLTRIILPAQFFFVLGGLLSAVLQAKDLHLLPALAPLVYSACIAGGLVGSHYAGLEADGFAWGVLIGAIIGAIRAAAVWLLQEQDALVSDAFNSESGYEALLLAVTSDHDRVLGVIVDEWIVKNQASYLAEGMLSYLQYGRTLMKVPIGVFGMAAGWRPIPRSAA